MDYHEEQNLNGGDHIVGEVGAAGAVFDKHLVQQTCAASTTVAL